MAAANSQINGTDRDDLLVPLASQLLGGKQHPAHILVDTAGDVVSPASQATLASILAALKAEDAAHASGDLGMQALSVRKDTAAATSGTDGDYQPLITDANGRLWVAAAKSATIDDIADVTLNNGSETSLVGSDSTRREAIIVAASTNTVDIRIGKTGQVGAARGAALKPGQSINLATTAAIYGYASAASQTVSITLLKD